MPETASAQAAFLHALLLHPPAVTGRKIKYFCLLLIKKVTKL
jgi:hypothetical protein